MSIAKKRDWKNIFNEPFSERLFFEDYSGRWYNSNGHELPSNIILDGDILIHLGSQKSKRSPLFVGQDIYTSRSNNFIQIGKLVFTPELERLQYFGKNLSGLGIDSIRLSNGEEFLSVRIGLEDYRFINARSYEPLVVHGYEIESLKRIIQTGLKRFYVVGGQDKIFTLSEDEKAPLMHEDNYLEILDEKIHTIGDTIFIKGRCNGHDYYFDGSTWEFCRFENLNGIVQDISTDTIFANGHIFKNIMTTKEKRCYDFKENRPFELAEIKEDILNLSEIKHSDFNLLRCETDNAKFVINSSNLQPLLVDTGVFIKEIVGQTKGILLNCKTEGNDEIVLDVRHGLEDAQQANSEGRKIKKAIGQPFALGRKVIQNVLLENYGAAYHCAVLLNDDSLSAFTFPQNLRADSESDLLSVFAGVEIEFINTTKKLSIAGREFYMADFRSMDNEKQHVLLDCSSGNPLRLEGVNHRYELVSNIYTTGEAYELGTHSMRKATTINERLLANTILFCEDSLNSWLPFHHEYLPILVDVVEVSSAGTWDYNLFQIGSDINEVEYIAVEKKPPYRVLADKQKGKYKPRVIKSKAKVLRSPEDLSAIYKVFANPGELISL